jgi:hypothetical protein
MAKGNDSGAPSRAQAERLRALASQAENLGGLASLAEAQLTRAGSDLRTLAHAAKHLADQLERAADGEAVER